MRANDLIALAETQMILVSVSATSHLKDSTAFVTLTRARSSGVIVNRSATSEDPDPDVEACWLGVP